MFVTCRTNLADTDIKENSDVHKSPINEQGAITSIIKMLPTVHGIRSTTLTDIT